MATSKKALAAEATEPVTAENDVKVPESTLEVEKPAEKKPAEKKTAEKKTAPKKSVPKKVSEKPAEKKIADSDEKKEKAAKKTPAKKLLTYDDVVAKTAKKILAADITKITDSISAEVKIDGECEGIFYIEIMDGKISVEPWNYENADIQIYTSSTELVNITSGKLNIYDAISSGAFKIFGNTGKAILLINAAF